jgi:hypothetical protein
MQAANIYSIETGYDIQCFPSPTGKTAISITSRSPLKYRAAYTGLANLGFNWVHTGKSTSWVFRPTLLDGKPATVRQETAQDGTNQITIELDRVMPPAGFIKTNATGAIRATAVHFDFALAYDLWIFLLCSSPAPLKLGFDKPSLAIRNGSAQASAWLSSRSEEPQLKAEASLSGDGFTRASMVVKRSIGDFKKEEAIGEFTEGLATFTWKPVLPNLNVVLVTHSDMSLQSFLAFLRSLGVDAKGGYFSFSYLPADFILSDGPDMEYTLQLAGDKRFLGHKKDQTRLYFKF